MGADGGARFAFPLGNNGIFEIEGDGVRGRRAGFIKQLRPRSGNEELTSHHAGRCKANIHLAGSQEFNGKLCHVVKV
jgi:hypothetical protein